MIVLVGGCSMQVLFVLRFRPWIHSTSSNHSGNKSCLFHDRTTILHLESLARVLVHYFRFFCYFFNLQIMLIFSFISIVVLVLLSWEQAAASDGTTIAHTAKGKQGKGASKVR